jgi:iron complex outermembrane receptor protein
LWLDNHFYGTVFSTQYKKSNDFSLTLGGGYNEYDGDHFGEVVWAEFLGNTEVENRYYDNNAFKTDGNIYAKAQYYVTNNLSGFLDLQLRRVTYDFLGKDKQQAPGGGEQIVDVQQTDRLNFFNPKAGLVYRNGNHRLFASFSVGNKEPTRDEYVNSTPENRPEHESLYNWEAGYKYTHDRFYGGVNLYYMDYKNQLIPELNFRPVSVFFPNWNGRAMPPLAEIKLRSTNSFWMCMMKTLPLSGRKAGCMRILISLSHLPLLPIPYGVLPKTVSMPSW